MREIYLDNCSTTRPDKAVIEEILMALSEDYGNPSSLHSKGFIIEKKVKEGRNTLSNFLNVSPEKLFFTSGGTESNNIAIHGIIEKQKKLGKHLITSKIEHPSVLNIFKFYEEKGFEVSYLNVDESGLISLEELEKEIREDTILISLMHVNNEIGSIQPVDSIKSLVEKKDSKALIHIDGVQAFCKINVDLKKMGVDSYSISGHKIYGPKGIGALYLKDEKILEPLILGGNQERGIRSGTENTPGILGFAKAVEIQEGSLEENYRRAWELKEYLLKSLSSNIDDIKINSPLSEDHSPYIVNVSFAHIRSEILLHYLEQDNIYISTGSACSKGTRKSHVLQAIKLNDELIDGSVRICFSKYNTKEDIDIFIEKTKKAVEEIREITLN